MAYPLLFDVAFRNQPALTLNAKLYDAAGAQVGGTITTGIVNLGGGAYSYLATLPDGHVGSFVIYDGALETRCIPFSINPQEAENSDAKVSGLAIAIVDAIKAYEVEIGHTFYTVMQRLYAVIRGASAVDNATTPTAVTYYAPDGTTARVTHALTPAGPGETRAVT